MMNKVYIGVDSTGNIWCIASDAENVSHDGLILIDEGEGERYTNPSLYYLPKYYIYEHQFRYKYENGTIIEKPEESFALIPPPPDPLVVTQKAATVMFRALAQTDVITPADALDNALMFPLWADYIGQRAEPGSYWRHADKLYRVNTGQGHTIQADWSPDKAASLFSLAANPADEWPDWIQPTGAHNAYAVGDKVTHDSKRWISTADANTWVPGEYGWLQS
ncbi:MAG: hypothetical protein PHX74_06835 [Candidatus Sumerlaeales bacterium]|nr:hypothetical protein [Candidatus Sumerlaeales bacterium]